MVVITKTAKIKQRRDAWYCTKSWCCLYINIQIRFKLHLFVNIVNVQRTHMFAVIHSLLIFNQNVMFHFHV